MEDKPHAELMKLAYDIYKGQVFTDRHLPPDDPGITIMVFMPLALMTKEQIAEFSKNPPGLIYEYLRAAGPRSVNGYPVFFSARMISVADAETVMAKVAELEKAEKADRETAQPFPDGFPHDIPED